MKPSESRITDAEWVRQRLDEEHGEPLELDGGPSRESDVDRLLKWSKRQRGVFIHEELDGNTYFIPDPSTEEWSLDDQIDYDSLNPNTDILIFDRDEDGNVCRREYRPFVDPLA